MGYVNCVSECWVCRRVFSYNPMRVPSIRINNQREPICRACVDRINPLREKNSVPPIVPHPDAYEACDESELDT